MQSLLQEHVVSMGGLRLVVGKTLVLDAFDFSKEKTIELIDMPPHRRRRVVPSVLLLIRMVDSSLDRGIVTVRDLTINFFARATEQIPPFISGSLGSTNLGGDLTESFKLPCMFRPLATLVCRFEDNPSSSR